MLRDDLAAIEIEFGRDTVSRVGVITEIGEYLRGGGGKRLRPALLLLAAKMLGHNGRGGIQLGAVVEIIHTATLVHDDIIDEAEIRRGRAAANVRWGNSKCVLAGDWLYMQAFKLAVQERNFRDSRCADRADPDDGGRRADPDGKAGTPHQRARASST